jgi:hypothetical protein
MWMHKPDGCQESLVRHASEAKVFLETGTAIAHSIEIDLFPGDHPLNLVDRFHLPQKLETRTAKTGRNLFDSGPFEGIEASPFPGYLLP